MLRAPPGFSLSTTVLARVDDEVLRLRAPGEVTRHAMLDGQTAAARDGLICDLIFGEGPLERGPFADDDLVTAPRATRFGRIVLPVPIVHPLVLAHAPDEVAAQAGISRKELYDITSVDDPTQLTWLDERLAATEHGATMMLHELPVLPPYLRPIKRDGEGGWLGSDLNILYQRVVFLAFTVRRDRYHGTLGLLIEAIHMLFENEIRPKPQTRDGDRPLASLRTFAVRHRLFEALTELDRRTASPDEGPLPRRLHHPIAALYAMGLELRR